MDWLNRELTACATALVEESMRRFGEVRIRIAGSSMLPVIRPGDIVSVRRCVPTQVSRGEIVLFIRDKRLFVHRVLGEKPSADGQSALITRGDSVPENDPPVFAGELLGCVTAIHRGRRVIVPYRTSSIFERMISSVLRRFEWPAKGLLRFYSLRAHLDAREAS